MSQRIGVKNLGLALLVAFAGLGAAPAATVPYYASFSREEAFVREGPSYQYPVLWTYRRKNLPVLVIQKYDVWRKIRDSEGTVGWVHSSMLSDRRTVVVTSAAPARISDGTDNSAHVVAFAQPGVVAKLEACKAEACRIMASGTEGWIKKDDVWGVGAGEVFK